MVVPVDPFEGGEFDRLEAPPGTAPGDEFGLVQPDDGLCQGVVAGISCPADGGFDPGVRQAPDRRGRGTRCWRFDPGVRQAPGVSQRQVLPPAVGMMDECSSFDVACVKGLLKRIGGPELGGKCVRHPPPTTRRAQASVTKVVQTNPRHVATRVRSDTHNASGRFMVDAPPPIASRRRLPYALHPAERCPSGRRSTPGKCVYVDSVPRVRIPPSPPSIIACGSRGRPSGAVRRAGSDGDATEGIADHCESRSP